MKFEFIISVSTRSRRHTKPSLATEQQDVNAKRDSQPLVLVWLLCNRATEGRCRLVTRLFHILEVVGYSSIQRPDI